MRGVATLVVVLGLVAGLTACGGGGEAEPTATPTGTPTAAAHSTPWPIPAFPTIIPDITATPPSSP